MIRITATLLFLATTVTVAFAQWTIVAPLAMPVMPGQYGGHITYCDQMLFAGTTRLLASNDTGNTWVDITPPLFVTGDNIRSIEAVDAKNIIVSTALQKIFKTADGGISWLSIPPPSGLVDYANFIGTNPNRIVIAGGKLSVSLDGGLTWRNSTGLPDFIPSVICRRSNQTCYAMAGAPAGAYMYRSTDLGLSWQRMLGRVDFDSFSFTIDPCDSTKYFVMNEELGAPTDGYSAIYSSRNGANTWTRNAPFLGFWYCGSIVRSQGILYVQTTFGVERSTDDGATFTRIGGPANKIDTRTLCAVSGNIIFASDADGNIYRTVNSGSDSLSIDESLLSAKIQVNKSILFATDTISKCDSLDRSFTIANIGCLPTRLSSAVLSGIASSDYSIVNQLPGAISENDIITIRFNPHASLSGEAILTLTFSDSSTKVISLQGFVRDNIPVQVLSTSQVLSVDTIGQVLDIPITLLGLRERQDVALTIRYDPKYMSYSGTHSVSGLSLDVGPINQSGMAPILIPAMEVALGSISANARFIFYGEEATARTTISFDSLTFPNISPNCKYLSSQSTANIDILGGCGIQILANYLRGRAIDVLQAYPNPTAQSLTLVSTSNLGSVKITVTDAVGAIMLSTTLELAPDKKPDLDFSSFPSGVYYIQVAGYNERIGIVLRK